MEGDFVNTILLELVALPSALDDFIAIESFPGWCFLVVDDDDEDDVEPESPEAMTMGPLTEMDVPEGRVAESVDEGAERVIQDVTTASRSPSS